MLPPRLDGIKRRLENKRVTELSNEEQELLKELQFLDRNEELRKSLFSEGKDLMRVVSGPGGRCPCCGR